MQQATKTKLVRMAAFSVNAMASLSPAAQGTSAVAADKAQYQVPAIVNLSFCRPTYSHEALLRSEHGVVKLEFTVGIRGKLVGSHIVKSSGFRDLDTAALTALMHCSFRPAYRDGMPIQASFIIDYEWKTGGAEQP